MNEDNKELKKLFSKFGWSDTDLDKFVEKADKKIIIEDKE